MWLSCEQAEACAAELSRSTASLAWGHCQATAVLSRLYLADELDASSLVQSNSELVSELFIIRICTSMHNYEVIKTLYIVTKPVCWSRKSLLGPSGLLCQFLANVAMALKLTPQNEAQCTP